MPLMKTARSTVEDLDAVAAGKDPDVKAIAHGLLLIIRELGYLQERIKTIETAVGKIKSRQ